VDEKPVHNAPFYGHPVAGLTTSVVNAALTMSLQLAVELA
jgi:hypothetical protein